MRNLDWLKNPAKIKRLYMFSSSMREVKIIKKKKKKKKGKIIRWTYEFILFYFFYFLFFLFFCSDWEKIFA